MFSGMVAALGQIVVVSPTAGGVRLRLDPGALAVDDVAIGDSIAVNGCCLTVVGHEQGQLLFDVSAESLRVTCGLNCPGAVNLEKALRLADRLGGHLVTGHVDAVGSVVAFDPVGDNRSLVVSAPASLARFIAPKGSVAVHGVSLTVNTVDDAADGCRFGVNVIPHTLAATTLGSLQPGDTVNLEVDLLARYAARYNDAMAGANEQHAAAVAGDTA